MADERVIKKYANRRLYDTSESRYVAMDDIRQLVVDGVRFRVIDAKTGDDISHSILLQIILEQEDKGQPIFSTRLLEHIIRYYGDTLQAFVSAYLEKSMETFVAQQQMLQDQMASLLHSAPKSILTEMAERNLALWARMQESVLESYVTSPDSAASQREKRTDEQQNKG
jgi:polyhydroxyalkanoate synthesis repressor PhaR